MTRPPSASSSRPSTRRQTASPASGTPARPSATRSSPWLWPGGPRQHRAGDIGAPDLHLPSRPAGHTGEGHGGGHGATRAHPGRRPLAPAGHRGHVRPLLRRCRRGHRGVHRCPRSPGSGRSGAPPWRPLPGRPARVRRTGAAGERDAGRARHRALLRVAGEQTDGTILWMANAQAVETHVVPRISAAAGAAGRPAPRIVRAPCGGPRRRRRGAEHRVGGVRRVRHAAQLPAHPRGRRRGRPRRTPPSSATRHR